MRSGLRSGDGVSSVAGWSISRFSLGWAFSLAGCIYCGLVLLAIASSVLFCVSLGHQDRTSSLFTSHILLLSPSVMPSRLSTAATLPEHDLATRWRITDLQAETNRLRRLNETVTADASRERQAYIQPPSKHRNIGKALERNN